MVTNAAGAPTRCCAKIGHSTRTIVNIAQCTAVCENCNKRFLSQQLSDQQGTVYACKTLLACEKKCIVHQLMDAKVLDKCDSKVAAQLRTLPPSTMEQWGAGHRTVLPQHVLSDRADRLLYMLSFLHTQTRLLRNQILLINIFFVCDILSFLII